MVIEESALDTFKSSSVIKHSLEISLYKFLMDHDLVSDKVPMNASFEVVHEVANQPCKSELLSVLFSLR